MNLLVRNFIRTSAIAVLFGLYEVSPETPNLDALLVFFHSPFLPKLFGIVLATLCVLDLFLPSAKAVAKTLSAADLGHRHLRSFTTTDGDN